MIEMLADMPPGTVGFRAGGQITPDDYTNVLGPELQKLVQSGTRLRTLYVIDAIDEMKSRALWEDAKLGFDLAVHNHGLWERSAIVTDEEWIARMVRLFAWMIPGEARVFAIAELEQAKAWVAG
jgi:hypothetical protein